jgi:hypothetical protein
MEKTKTPGVIIGIVGADGNPVTRGGASFACGE